MRKLKELERPYNSETLKRTDGLNIHAMLSRAAVADENDSVENRWYQLRGTVQSYALAALGRARRKHQDWFNDKDAAIGNLLAEKNRLHKACIERSIDDNKAAF
ncbi:hypothetical protein SprV_0100283600 [Sparganum proliferum]